MRFLRRALPGVLLASALAACGDSTAPVAPENLPIENADVATVATSIDSIYTQPIFAQLRGAGFVALRGNLQVAVTAPTSGLRLRGTLDARRARIAAEWMPGEPVVPSLLRGVTFVWNGADYVVDTLANGTPRPGAPSNGVRFMLYAISEATGQPTGSPLGYLEVVDLSTSTTARWTARVVTTAGVTMLESTTAVTGTSESNASFTQSGFVSDGTRRVEQSLSATANGVRASWRAPFAGVSMEASISGTLTGITFSYSFTTPKGSLRIAMTQREDGGSAQIFVNGALWARQSWSADGELDDSAWQKADGSGPISEADTLTLLDTLDFFIVVAALADFDSSIEAILAGATAP